MGLDEVGWQHKATRNQNRLTGLRWNKNIRPGRRGTDGTDWGEIAAPHSAKEGNRITALCHPMMRAKIVSEKQQENDSEGNPIREAERERGGEGQVCTIHPGDRPKRQLSPNPHPQ